MTIVLILPGISNRFKITNEVRTKVVARNWTAARKTKCGNPYDVKTILFIKITANEETP